MCNKPSPLELSQFLINLRQAQESTCEQVSARSGINPRTLMRWEAGTHSPRIPELESVLEALNANKKQRLQAFASLESPRAVRKIRELTDFSPPFPGDLLRAMRTRIGMTQSELASAISVRQATLAKWESSEDWPETSRLSSICFYLGASLEETEVLLNYDFSPNDTDCKQILHDLDQTSIALMCATIPTDLEFLALESRLWNASLVDESIQSSLNLLYGRHARKLVYLRRFNDAKPYISQVMRTTSYKIPEELFYRDALVARALFQERGTEKQKLKIKTSRLKETIEVIAYVPIIAWLQEELSKCSSMIEDWKTAIDYSDSSINLIQAVANRENSLWARSLGRARLEGVMGNHDSAVEKITKLLSMTPHESDYEISAGLAATQIFLKAGLKTEATLWEIETRNLIAQYQQPQFLDDLNSIQARSI